MTPVAQILDRYGHSTAAALPPSNTLQEWIDIADGKRERARASMGPPQPEALARKQGLIDTILRTGPSHAVTLIWNPKDGWLTAERVRIDVDRLHCRVDRDLLGKRYNKKPNVDRTGNIGFIEHIGTNTHVHLAWRVPKAYHAKFARSLYRWWDRHHPYGEAQVRTIYDAVGWASYISKAQWRFPNAEDAELLISANTITL